MRLIPRYRLSRLAWAAIRWRLRFRCDRRRRLVRMWTNGPAHRSHPPLGRDRAEGEGEI